MSKEKTNSQNTKKNTTKKNKEVETEEKVTKTKTKSKDTKKQKPNKKEVKEIKKEEKKVIEVEEEVFDDEYYDEDLEDIYYEEEITETKPEKKEKKKETKKEETSKENIKKIEKIAKEKSKKQKKTSNNIKKFGLFLEENRNVISSFIAGVLITILIVILIWPDRIATLKDGTQPVVKVGKTTYTANDLYDRMKEHYSVSQLLDKIDTDLLEKIYPETDEMNEEVKSNAEYYINMYKQYYNYTEEQFLQANGFSSYDAYIEYLKLDNRRKQYLDEYVEENLKDDEIQKYYDENVYGDINCQHILVETSSEDSSDSESKDDNKKLSDEDAKKLAEEIITKINDGTSWDDIKKEYKDKVTFEDLGYQSWDSDLEDTFKDALKDMDDNSYSEEPVKTSYGYHVIYRLDQKKAPSLKKAKSTIVEKLVSEKEEKDSNLQYKALISLREKNNIKFSDTDMKAKYESYIKQYK